MMMGREAQLSVASGWLPQGARLRSELTLGTVWTHFLVWLAVSACTLGLGWIVVSGHFFRMLINSTIILDAEGHRIGHLECTYDVEADPVRILRWVLFSIVTLGIGLLFYSFRSGKLALSTTRIVWD